MSTCCTPKGYRQIFSEKRAQVDARRYRRKGLDRTSRRIAGLLTDRGVGGQTLLEVGAGIGAIQIELLKAGAARAVSVELTPTYEEAAAALLHEAGVEDRVERRVLDFAETSGEVETADIVIMNRVICCYPDMPKLAGAAADRARRVLVMSFPKESWWTRIGMTIANFGMRVSRREFQIFLHPLAEILATAEQHGLKMTHNQVGFFWQITALERSA